MAFSIAIKVIDGRAMNLGEDWGKVYEVGDALPCCDCKYGGGASLRTSRCACRCHQTSRAWLQLPQVAS